jgi:site-specific DNA-methyltransferase (adenine-specific)
MRLNYIDNIDCLEGMKAIPDGSVDLVVTDPPYLISYATNYRKDKTHDFCSVIANDNNPGLIRDALRECYRVLKPDSAAYVFCSAKTLDTFKSFAVETGFTVKNTIVWVKNNWTAGDLKAQYGQQYEPLLLLNKGRALIRGKRLTDVWAFDRVAGKSQLHQNQKPVELIAQCIEKHSDPGDTVLDPFMGSGTTAVAAMRAGRNFIGFELSPEYHAIATQRIAEEAGPIDDDDWML